MTDLEFTTRERVLYGALGGIVRDPSGAEVLAGLNREETKFYLCFTRDFDRDPQSVDATRKTRYLELHRRHSESRRQGRRS